MKKQLLLWVGAGDLAQRTLNFLNLDTWHTTSLNRSSNQVGFDEHVSVDVTQATSLKLFSEATHIIYSAIPAGRTPADYAAIYDVGLKNILKNIDKNNLVRFVFVSSTAVYGADPVPQDEYALLNPIAFNGQALVKAEQFLRQELDDKLTVIRFTGLYGPGRDYLFNQLRAGKVKIHPALDNYANRIHIEDAARVCAHVLELVHPAASYIGTDSTPIPIRHLYTHIAHLLNAPNPAFDSSLSYSSRHFSNQRLLTSGNGFQLLYPDTIKGYSALLKNQ